MSEEKERAESVTEATTAGVDSIAAALALGGASRNKADAFLDRQRALADLQIRQIEQVDPFEVSHLRWRRFNDQMKGAMQIMLVLTGALIVVVIGAALWN